MYEAFYGFKEKPFSMLPDPGFLYLSKQHRAALTLLEYGLLNHVGFCVISGEAGAGKTTILRALLERVEDDVKVGLITNTHQSFGGLLDWVLSAFDLHKPNLTHVEMHQVFMDYLIEEYANGRTVLLIVDEAQNMKPDALEELRMLSNINSAKDQLMQVVLSGQPALKETLRMPELMQFAQRIAVDYHLESLNLEETCGYIQHRLITAGAKKDVFTPAACERIHNYSGGTPRLINLLCETVLVYGFADQQELIGVELVDEMVLERMKDSVVPIVNRDIAKKSNKEESAELEKNFPHIKPEEDVEEAGNDQAAMEVQKIIKGYRRPDMADATEAAVAEKKEVKTVAKQQGSKKDKEGSSNRGRAAAVSSKSPSSEKTSSSQADSSSVSISKASNSTLPPTENRQQADESGSESGKQLIQYVIKAGAVALVLVALAFMLNNDEPAEIAEVKEVPLEVQAQREQEDKRLRQLQIEAETLKKERDAAVAEAEEERQAKAAAEKRAAEKATAAAAAAELKRKANEKKKLAAAKKRERIAKQAEEKAKAEAKVAKQKALELEKERLYMQAQLDEQRRLKEQEAARRRVLEYEEQARRQLAIEAAAKEATEAAEATASKAKKSVDCSGPVARFKASCRR